LAQAAAEDIRIRVVTAPENRGAGAARALGMEQATGRYIWFADPDDRYDPTLLDRVAQSLERSPAEVVMFGAVEEYYTDGALTDTRTIVPEACVCDTAEQVRERVLSWEKQTLYGYTWNKVYSLEAIRARGVRYEQAALCEDLFFNVDFFAQAQTANVLDAALYRYGKRSGGNLTGRFVPEYYALHRRRIEELYAQQCAWGRDSAEVRALLGGLYGRYIFSALSRNCDPRAAMTGRQRAAWCREVFGDTLYRTLLPAAQADSAVLRVCLWCLRRRVPLLWRAMGRAVYMAQSSALLQKIKNKR
jgi:glycosyltransferase involved in cell wall biosynthesis